MRIAPKTQQPHKRPLHHQGSQIKLRGYEIFFIYNLTVVPSDMQKEQN